MSPRLRVFLATLLLVLALIFGLGACLDDSPSEPAYRCDTIRVADSLHTCR